MTDFLPRPSLPVVAARDFNLGQWLAFAYDPEKSRDKAVEEVIGVAETSAAPSVYDHAFRRWKSILEALQCTIWKGRITEKLFHDIGAESVLESNVFLHRLYGTPLLHAETVKGAARAAAKDAGWDETQMNLVFGSAGDGLGLATFYDALWAPGSADTPLCRDVDTPHHVETTRSGGATVPTDFDEPVPLYQLAVVGEFLFAIDAPDPKLQATIAELLQNRMRDVGIGAKVNVGYGRIVNFCE